MKKIFFLVIGALVISGLLSAQTLNVQQGQVTYQFPAEQTGLMPYSNGTTLNVMNKVFTLADVSSMYVDESAVVDNTVNVVYNGGSVAITVAGNVAQYLTITTSGAHVNIAQSSDLAQEITYTLSGNSTDGEFYMSGSYKATVELNGLSLTNTNPVSSGAAIHIQNGKRIKVKVVTGTTNTLVDAASGSQKGALYIKGHAEFAQYGTLNITAKTKHGIKTGEYFSIKNATINVTSTAGDGINCAQYFLMESGTLNLTGLTDDGIQCDIENASSSGSSSGSGSGTGSGTTDGTVPTNAELWEAFKPYYNTFYGLSRADQPIENVATFAPSYMQEIMTSASSEYKWLGDYILQVASAQGYNVDSEALWRWHVDSFFNCRQRTSWPKTADFSTAGQPSAWGSAYLAAKGASALPQRRTGETTDHEGEDSGNIYIQGGTIKINTTGVAAKGIKADGDLIISDGTIDITTSGKGKWDSTDMETKAASCLNSDVNTTISGGTLTLKSSGSGGKGINCDGKLTISGGTITVATTGGLYYNNGTTENTNYTGNTDNVNSSYYSSPKGIKVDGAITISGGNTNVSTSGRNGEGIESKSTITISNGQVTVNSYDDGINSAGDLTVTGGYVYARATNNDGFDSNGNTYIKGGLCYAVGANSPEVAFDANSEQQKKLYVQGGTLIAVGGLESGASITGGTCKQASSMSANTWYALYDNGTLVAAFLTPNTSSSTGSGGRPGGGGGSQTLVVYTSSTPTLKSSVSVSGGTSYFGGAANIGGTVSGGSSVTLSDYTSSGGPGGRP